MRTNLDKKHYTKSERIFGRLLQENHIDFLAKVLILEREVDFLIGNVCVEINGHEQDGERNHQLANAGYIPLHIQNQELYEDRLKVINIIKQLLWNIAISQTG